MTHWLIHEPILRDMRLKIQLMTRSGLFASDERMKAFEASIANITAADGPRNYKSAGRTAEITVEGLLSPKPDFWAWLLGMGNTTYSDIIAAFAKAEADPAIGNVVLKIGSGGGYVSGLFETLAVIERFRTQISSKPISVVASIAQSAAFAIAAVAGPIAAASPASEFGSIGIATQMFIDPFSVDITSTDAPKKRPNPATEEGRAMVREELDALHGLFVDAIAWGRGTSLGKSVTRDDVNTNYGQGGSFLAEEARRRGMIDGAPKQTLKPLRANNEGMIQAAADGADAASHRSNEEMSLDINTLKTEHRALYDQVFDAGSEAGMKKERDRVCGHLTLGEECGAMDIAITAIRDGSEQTATLNAKYIGRAAKQGAQTARQGESDSAGTATDTANKTNTSGKNLLDQIADQIAPEPQGK